MRYNQKRACHPQPKLIFRALHANIDRNYDAFAFGLYRGVGGEGRALLSARMVDSLNTCSSRLAAAAVEASKRKDIKVKDSV